MHHLALTFKDLWLQLLSVISTVTLDWSSYSKIRLSSWNVHIRMASHFGNWYHEKSCSVHCVSIPVCTVTIHVHTTITGFILMLEIQSESDYYQCWRYEEHLLENTATLLENSEFHDPIKCMSCTFNGITCVFRFDWLMTQRRNISVQSDCVNWVTGHISEKNKTNVTA